jgi:AraC-like DNA-binding protein
MDQIAEIASLIASRIGPDEVAKPFPGLRLVAASTPTSPINSLYEPAFALVVQGAKRTVLSDRVFDYAAGQYLVVSVELPVVGHVVQASVDAPYLSLSLALKPAAIAALLLETVTSGREPVEPSGMAVSMAPPDLTVLGPMLEREILWRLLTGEQGAFVRQIGLADSRLSQVGRAIRWIRGHYAEPLAMDQLARVAGMSASSFHRHFRAVTAMSPLQYQKRIRLQEARSRLIDKGEDVAAVGFDVGYQSPSQFSREYARQFGAPPGRDAARLLMMPTPDRGLG